MPRGPLALAAAPDGADRRRDAFRPAMCRSCTIANNNINDGARPATWSASRASDTGPTKGAAGRPFRGSGRREHRPVRIEVRNV